MTKHNRTIEREIGVQGHCDLLKDKVRTWSRPYPRAEHLGNSLVVGSPTDHQTGGNLTCSGRPFRRISPYLLSDVRDYILHPHGVTPQSRNH